MSEHVDGKFTGAAGKQIYWQAWLPSEEPVGVVVIVHGYAEHSGRYTHVADRLVSAGYATYALDCYGHGKSEGSRANVNRMSELVTDVDRVLRMAAAKHPEHPVFLLAHSLGTIVALDYVIGTPAPLAGLVLSGVLMEVTVGSKPERLAARLLSPIAGNVPVTPFDPALVSRDPAVVQAYVDDPLNYHGKVKIRTGAETLAVMDRVKPQLSKVEVPLLLLHGGVDKINLVSGVSTVADAVSTKDVTVKVYDDAYHEVFNEPEQDVVLGDLVDWLKAHS